MFQKRNIHFIRYVEFSHAQPQFAVSHGALCRRSGLPKHGRRRLRFGRSHRSYPFTPPEVSPATRCFSMSRNSTITGIVANSDVANRYCHWMKL